MRAFQLHVIFIGLIVFSVAAPLDAGACEGEAGCDSQTDLTRMAELNSGAAVPCNPVAGRPCRATDAVDKALNTIFCGDGFGGTDCEANRPAADEAPAAMIMQAPEAESGAAPISRPVYAEEEEEEDGC